MNLKVKRNVNKTKVKHSPAIEKIENFTGLLQKVALTLENHDLLKQD